MTETTPPAVQPGAWRYPTFAMLGLQTLASMSVMTTAVLAPVAAIDYGVPATSIGLFTSAAYICAMLSGAATGKWMRQIGATGVAIATALASGIGLALFAIATPLGALAAAILIGGAYGTVNPVSAYALNLVAPSRLRAFIFSIKQTGVVIAGAFTGALVPLSVSFLGWKMATVLLALLAVVVVLTLLPLRGRFHDDGDDSDQSVIGAVIHSLTTIWHDRQIGLMALAGMAYSGVQVSISAFLVLYLTDARNMSLVEAGAVFAACQTAAVFGRLGWGVVADRLMKPVNVLVWIAVISAVALLALTFFTNSVPALVLTAAILGFTSFGWNGVFISEITSRVRREQVGDIIGGVQFVFFGGVVLFPPVFAVIVQSAGYTAAYVTLAVVAAAGGLALLLVTRPDPKV